MGRGFESLCRYQTMKKHLRHCDLSQVLFVFRAKNIRQRVSK